MVSRITDATPSKKISAELSEIIEHSKRFSHLLKKLLHDYDVDISSERKATVEVLEVIMQKWMVEIIHALFIEGPMRFNQLKRDLKGISSRTLTSKLRLLEDKEFVKRKIVSHRPTVVEYSLTGKGQVFAELSCPIILYLKIGGP